MANALIFELEESAVAQVGIQSIVVTEEGIMYITLTTGEIITSPSLKGPKGDPGPAGSVDDVLVNGVSVLDDASNAQISILTEEQAITFQTETIQIILDKLANEYYDNDTIQDFIADLDTQIQSAVAQTDTIYQDTVNFIDSFTSNLMTILTSLNDYVYVNNDVLHLGPVGATIRLTLTDNVCSVLFNGSAIASFEGGKFTTQKVAIANSLQLGDFIIITQKDGSIILEKVGE